MQSPIEGVNMRDKNKISICHSFNIIHSDFTHYRTEQEKKNQVKFFQLETKYIENAFLSG